VHFLHTVHQNSYMFRSVLDHIHGIVTQIKHYKYIIKYIYRQKF